MTNSEPSAQLNEKDEQVDWRMAQEEVLLSEADSKPMQDVIERLERQYEEEKKRALDNQKRDFERQFQKMKLSLTSSTMTNSTPSLTMNQRLQPKSSIMFNRLLSDESMRQQFNELRDSIIKANVLVREANMISEELTRSARYNVSLQVKLITGFLHKFSYFWGWKSRSN